MQEDKKTYEREVKAFGDGGAHVTLPSDLKGDKVKIQTMDWDNELDAEIERLHDQPFATKVENRTRTDRYASPNVRKKVLESPNEIALGLVEGPGRADDTLGEHYTLPISVMESHITILGRTGYGRTTLLQNIAWQQANSSLDGRFCFIGANNSESVDSFKNLLESAGIDFEYVNAGEWHDVQDEGDILEKLPEINTDTPLLVDASLSFTNLRSKVVATIIDHITTIRPEDEDSSYPVFIDDLPAEDLTQQKLLQWDEQGISIITTMQYVEQLEEDIAKWFTNNSEVISFKTNQESAEKLAEYIGESDIKGFKQRLSNINIYNVMMCNRGQTVVATYPKIPPL